MESQAGNTWMSEMAREITDEMIEFDILGGISDIETIVAGRGVYIRRYLERTYGKGRWRKMKGMA